MNELSKIIRVIKKINENYPNQISLVLDGNIGQNSIKQAEIFKEICKEIGFPIVVRPSYVLGGRAMELVHTQVELEKYLKEAVEVSDKKPI